MTHQGCRILVVDDVRTLTQLLEMFLSRRGFQVQTVNDSRTAVQAAIDFLPTVVLLDINMPFLDGYEVARRIRQQPGIQSVPIISITSHNDDVHHRRSAEAGIGHHLTKPCSFSELETLLRQHCN